MPAGLTPSDPHAPGAEGPAGTSFRDLLGSSLPVEKSAMSQPGISINTSAEVSSEPAALAQAVRNGALTADQAIDRLVEHTLASVAGPLSPSQQAELRALLVEAVQVDPALRQLRDAIG